MTTQGNQDMLYQFMSFLKTVNAVHHLQFCLTVGKSVLQSLIFIGLDLRWSSPTKISDITQIIKFAIFHSDDDICPKSIRFLTSE